MTNEQTIAALVEHEGFVRSLARSLVRDHALADDLAQDTWVAALRHPPASASSPRGWLATVMRNQLHNLRRSNARREARESVAARYAVGDRSETLHGRLGLQHLVVEAVLALASTQRDVILLHYCDGLSAAEIARQRGLPAATVRSQLKRGLDHVRARLDRDHPGGRASWCTILLALERDVPEASPASMGRGSGVVWGAGVLVLGAIAFNVLGAIRATNRQSTGTDAALVPSNPAPSSSPAPANLEGVAMDDPVMVARVPIPVPPQRVTVVCNDTSGRLLPDVEVWIFQDAQRPDGKHWFREFGPFTSNVLGRVEGPIALTTLDHWHSYLVYARVPGQLVGLRLGAQLEEKDRPFQSIELTLMPSRTVAGTVSVPEWFDITGVNVRVHSLRAEGYRQTGGILPRTSSFPGLESILPERFESSVDQNGLFELQDVPIGGMLHLMAEAPGLGQAQYANVGRGHVPIADLVEFEMLPEGLIVGTLTGPGGAPVPDARVSVRAESGNGIWVTEPFEAATDATGEFHIGGLPAAQFDISVEVSRRDEVFRPQTIHVEQGKATSLDLQMEFAVRVAGTVVDATTGAGIEGVCVMAIAPREYGSPPTLGHANSDAAGAFELWLPTGGVSLYIGGKPMRFAFPDPQIVKTFVIGDDRAPVEGLRFTLQLGDDK